MGQNTFFSMVFPYSAFFFWFPYNYFVVPNFQGGHAPPPRPLPTPMSKGVSATTTPIATTCFFFSRLMVEAFAAGVLVGSQSFPIIQTTKLGERGRFNWL
jgi:hypothetical protein